MEPLTLKQRQPEEFPEVENWDDDEFENLDDVQFRAASTATSIMSHPQTGHRDSISSRMSIRSDSNQGDENWDVLVDEQSPIKDAIALAKSKGIPLPSNLPRSALEGGTIRRLKGKEIKKAIADDWSEDIDMPTANAPLKLAKHEDRNLSESLRSISAAFRGSPKSPELSDPNLTIKSPKSRIVATPVSLDAFRDNDDDDAFADVPTIRVAKSRSPQKPTLFTPASIGMLKKPEPENIEEDLELPTDGQLRLSTKKPIPKTPQQADDFDFEWGEGSLGFKTAGKGRGGRSARSSSASALSPSVSSAFTAESEDDGLDGLVLPEGPIKFQEQLKKRQSEPVKDLADGPTSAPKPTPEKDDFFDDFDMGDGDVFNSAKLTLNRNIKQKPQRSTSPSKRTTTTLNFTSTKTQSTISRLPRFQPSHERARSTLEPVSESGAAVSRFQRPGSRLGQHSTQSSVSSIPTPTTPTPSTPSRRGLRPAESRVDMRYQPPTTTNAQLLRAKRSMPVMQPLSSPSKAGPYVRPPSRQEAGSRLNPSYERPESRLSDARKPAIPFLPAGASHGQSQHVTLKGQTAPRHYRRQDSDGSGESMSAAQRSLSRLAGLGRPETPGRGRSGMSAAELAAQAKKQITKPTRRRNYGDGSELEIFDDLPTSASTESKFTKLPIGRGAPRSLRSKLGLSLFNQSTTSLASTIRGGTETPLPQTPLSPVKHDFPTTATTVTNIPRFARDTAASRIAREQRQISTTFQNIHGEPLQPISANFKISAAPRSNTNSLRKKKNVQQKPHLIKPMGNDVNRERTEKGMSWNPQLYRWEGNENALAPFDVPPPDFYPRQPSPLGQDARGKGSPGGGREKVALISQIGNVSGVQVVGGMVFDPRSMRWLKMAENTGSTMRGGGGGSVGDVEVEEEEDVFAGLEDLKEEDENKSHRSSAMGRSKGDQQYGVGVAVGAGPGARERKVSGESAGSADDGEHSSDEYGGGVVAEEFDVGPEFVRRQRAEEDRWRRKVEKWLRGQEEEEQVEDAYGRGGWRWGIRDLVQAGSGETW